MRAAITTTRGRYVHNRGLSVTGRWSKTVERSGEAYWSKTVVRAGNGGRRMPSRSSILDGLAMAAAYVASGVSMRVRGIFPSFFECERCALVRARVPLSLLRDGGHFLL